LAFCLLKGGQYQSRCNVPSSPLGHQQPAWLDFAGTCSIDRQGSRDVQLTILARATGRPLSESASGRHESILIPQPDRHAARISKGQALDGLTRIVLECHLVPPAPFFFDVGYLDRSDRCPDLWRIRNGDKADTTTTLFTPKSANLSSASVSPILGCILNSATRVHELSFLGQSFPSYRIVEKRKTSSPLFSIQKFSRTRRIEREKGVNIIPPPGPEVSGIGK